MKTNDCLGCGRCRHCVALSISYADAMADEVAYECDDMGSLDDFDESAADHEECPYCDGVNPCEDCGDTGWI